MCPSKKLLNKYVGPFQITKIIEKQAYKLVLSKNWKIFSVFHVSFLKPYRQKANKESS